LQAVSALAATMPGVVLSEVLVPQICVPLARDRVVNVRIAAAEALIKCADKLQSENPAFVKDCIRPVLFLIFRGSCLYSSFASALSCSFLFFGNNQKRTSETYSQSIS
jgi:hypothetical protein